MKIINKYASKPLDVHLMIIEPNRYIKDFADLGSEILTIHYEASTHLHRNIQTIKSEGMKAGVAINPHTPVKVLEPIISEIDVVCLMSVNPGFGGQSFIETTYDKVLKLKNLIKKKNASTLIEIDGGVNDKNSAKLIENGADILVSGNYIFSDPNPNDAINRLR